MRSQGIKEYVLFWNATDHLKRNQSSVVLGALTVTAGKGTSEIGTASMFVRTGNFLLSSIDCKDSMDARIIAPAKSRKGQRVNFKPRQLSAFLSDPRWRLLFGNSNPQSQCEFSKAGYDT